MTVEYIRPNADISCTLLRSTGDVNYVLVDEAVPSTTDYVYISAGITAAGEDVYGLETVTKLSPRTEVIGYVYLGIYESNPTYPGTFGYQIALYKGTTLLAETALTATRGGWYSVSYTGQLEQAEIDDLRLHVYLECTAGWTFDGKTGINTYYPTAMYCYTAYCTVEPVVTPIEVWPVVIEAMGAVDHATALAEWAASVTAVVAEASAAVSSLASCDATVTDFPTIPNMNGELYPPTVKIEVYSNMPTLKCTGVLSRHIGFGSCAIAIPLLTCAGGITSNNVVSTVYHSIYLGNYFTHHSYPNRVYVISKDNLDNFIYGEAHNDTRISEYGEVMYPMVTDIISTDTVMATVASTVLSKLRMTTILGEISVPPNCSMEIGDVIEIRDLHGNQTGNKYRVAGYSFKYDPTGKVTQFKHTIRLTEV
jgi:hypothetical protein